MKMTKKEAAHLGALARMKKYGNPGTPEGRRRGGINSALSQVALENRFKTAKKHAKPRNSGPLAEFMGILLGDGHLSNYQVLVTTNSQTDYQHALHVKMLIKNLFGLEASLNKKKDQNAVNVVVSSVNLVHWLSGKGMPIGNKLNSGLAIPKWIKRDAFFQKNFIRGLFDTDGCVYFDKHIIKGKKYRNCGWTLTSYSDRLRKGVWQTLTGLGFSPTLRKTQKSVYMRRKHDIQRYFQDIGTSNPKHLRRYQDGRVPKRS